MSETAPERLSRLLALVPWLRAHDGITIAEAAAHFQISDEQLSKDLWQLIVCGIPGYGPDQLVDIQFWDDDRIHVLDPITLERPLRLTGEEVAALHLGLRVLNNIPGAQAQQSILSAMVKLEALGESTLTLDITMADQSSLIATLDDAISRGSVVEIEYASGDADVIEKRRIQPRSSFSVDGFVYVHAWCFLADAVRTFRTDRIVSFSPTPDEPPPSTPAREDPPALRRDPENMSTALIHIAPDALWILDSEPVERVADAEWGAEQSPEEASGGTRAKIHYASVDWLVRWVMGHAGAVSVVEPVEVRSLVRRAAHSRLHSG